MIVNFNSVIFNSNDTTIQSSIADVFNTLIKNNVHFIDIRNIYNVFYNIKGEYIFDNNVIAKNFLSVNSRIYLKEYISKKHLETVTRLHNLYLKKITIGLTTSETEINPFDANKILSERSKIIVENGINDWNFLKGVCQKYTNYGIRKSIYKLIDKSIKSDFIESDSGGGIGEVLKQTKKWIDSDRYKNIYQYKLMVLFDSDKNIDNGYITPHKTTVEFLKNKEIITIQANDYLYELTDKIVWHILYKRKLENYLPLNVLKINVNLSQAQITDLDNKTPQEMDYIQYTQANIGLSDGMIKAKFPVLFVSNFSPNELESTCSHHQVFCPISNQMISEIEVILLKIAKII